ncbi:MAG: hypothetical protein ABFS09_01575 [Thermodesulfobacteriota bacterium]
MVDQYLQHLMALIGNNKIFASYEFMKSLPPNTPIPNKNNLFSDLEVKVNEARLLTREVNRLLKKADYPKALGNLLKAKRLVPDFPNIQNDIDFIEGTITNLQQSLSEAEKAAKKGKQKKVREFLDTAHKIDGRNIAISRIEKKLQKSLQRNKIRNILLTSMVILTPFVYSGYEIFSYMEGNSHWTKANSYIARHEYQLAKLEMEKVEKNLNKVHFLNQPGKLNLLGCTKNMIASTRFQQGLLGKVLHGDTFIDLANKIQLDKIALLTKKAEQNVTDKNWSVALTEYQQALDVALKDEDFHHVTINKLHKSILDIRDIMYVQYEDVGKVSFRGMVKQADLLFNEKRWDEAMNSYGQALRFAQENRVSDYDLVTRISKARHVADINNSLEEAQALLALNKSIEARKIFERIIEFSEENGVTGLAATAISREMIAKIDKNVFLNKIDTLEMKAGKLRLEKKYEESLAYYHELLQEIGANSNKLQLNLADREKMVKETMAEISKQQVVSSQHRFLLSAYQNILRKTFNLSKNIRLKQPEIVFLKNDNNVLIYKVTALGTQDSNTSAIDTKYEVDYKFDMGTGAWALNGSPIS